MVNSSAVVLMQTTVHLPAAGNSRGYFAAATSDRGGPAQREACGRWPGRARRTARGNRRSPGGWLRGAEAGGGGPVGGPGRPVRGARGQRFGGEGTDHPAALDDIVEFHADQRRPVAAGAVMAGDQRGRGARGPGRSESWFGPSGTSASVTSAPRSGRGWAGGLGVPAAARSAGRPGRCRPAGIGRCALPRTRRGPGTGG